MKTIKKQEIMKTKWIARFFFSYMLVIVAVLFNSCSKDSIEDDDASSYGTMQAKINGSLIILKPLMPVLEINNNGIVSVYGYKDEKGISISFPDTIGNYSFESADISAKFTVGDPFDIFDINNDGPVIDFYAMEGSVNITEINIERVIGTFNFIGKSFGGETRTVTNGEFNISRE